MLGESSQALDGGVNGLFRAGASETPECDEGTNGIGHGVSVNGCARTGVGVERRAGVDGGLVAVAVVVGVAPGGGVAPFLYAGCGLRLRRR